MEYFSDVKAVLGDEVVQTMVEFSTSEQFPSEQLLFFAFCLCEKLESKLIYGNAKRRNKVGADGLRDILCDWYSEELFEVTADAALDKLVTVLETINVKPLALALAKIRGMRENERDQPVENFHRLSAGSGTESSFCNHNSNSFSSFYRTTS